MNHPLTFQDRVRHRLSWLLNAIGLLVGSWGIHPNVITWVGLIPVAIGAVLISRGEFTTAGIVLILGLPLDALDGAVAKAMKLVSSYGGVLDSTLDRYADGMLFGGLVYYYASQQQLQAMAIALLALVANFGVSYIRARAGQAKLEVRVGILDRMVRLVILLIGLFIPDLLFFAVVLIAVLGVFTNIQRLDFSRQNLDRG